MKWRSAGLSRATHDVRRLTNSAYIPRVRGLEPSVSFQSVPLPGVTHSLKDCTEERAKELREAGFNSVLWSGGVDSSLVALAMSETSPVTLLYTAETEKTGAPELWQELETRGCQFVRTSGQLLQQQAKAGLRFVTGTHGDDLFLGDHAVGLVDRVWGMGLEELLSAVSGRPSHGGMWDYYRYLFDPMPLEQTAANCLWWVGFCFQWHWASCYLTMSNDLGAPGVTHAHFFDSVPFQRWMLQDASLRAGRTEQTHKQLAVDLCSEMAGRRLTFPSKSGGWDLIRQHGLAPVLSADEHWTFTRATK